MLIYHNKLASLFLVATSKTKDVQKIFLKNEKIKALLQNDDIMLLRRF